MEDHETRRKIIREWMLQEELPKIFALRKRVPSQSTRSGPSISARPVPEDYGMAFASRWEVVIGRSAKIFGSSSCRAFGFFRYSGVTP